MHFFPKGKQVSEVVHCFTPKSWAATKESEHAFLCDACHGDFSSDRIAADSKTTALLCHVEKRCDVGLRDSVTNQRSSFYPLDHMLSHLPVTLSGSGVAIPSR